MYNSSLLRGVSVGAILLAISTVRLHAQDTLPTIEIGSDEKRQNSKGPAPGFDATRAKEPIYRDPPGQTVTTVDHKFLDSTPMFTVREMLQYSPGVSLQQGNTPRDVVISIRGSANRIFAGVRNIMMYEDGFPIMTSDGNGRTDILDPHAFGAIDVYRGPSSAMFGNYAYGGAINYRSLSGAQIDGFEVGAEFGSFGYFNDYIRAGAAISDKNLGDFDASLFVSRASADNFIDHNAYEVGLAKALFKWSPTPSDRFISQRALFRQFHRTPITSFSSAVLLQSLSIWMSRRRQSCLRQHYSACEWLFWAALRGARHSKHVTARPAFAYQPRRFRRAMGARFRQCDHLADAIHL